MTLPASQFRRCGKVVTAWRRPLLLTHARPDGDALGCLVAMRSIFRASGSVPTAISLDPIPGRYGLLVEREDLQVWGVSAGASDLDACDGVLVLDTCTYSQLEAVADWLRGRHVPLVALDHHVTRDDLADEYLVDETAGAACVLVHEWAGACEWELDDAARLALFVGIATDTGWFRFSNTDGRVLEACASLIREGVSPETVYRRLFEGDTAERVRLFGCAVAGMELFAGGRLAVMSVSRGTLSQCGATAADTEDVVNEPMRIGSVEVSVLLVETEGAVIKASFRSKGGVDVAAAARRLGGGGHVRAAGARVPGDLQAVKRRIVAEVIRFDG